MNRVDGVIFESTQGTFFCSDSQPLVYRWNSYRKWWEYIPMNQTNHLICEEYIRQVHSGRWFNASVRPELLCSGIQFKGVKKARRFA